MYPDKFKYKVIKITDSAIEKLSDYFLECFAFIDEARDENGVVLVHCYQGVSRSVSVVIAYLMLCNDITFGEAYAQVRAKRAVAAPNNGFIF